MVKVMVTSHIYGKTKLSGQYILDPKTTIAEFVASLQVKWDDEALIVVNDRIVESEYDLQDGDHIYLLIPLAGG